VPAAHLKNPDWRVLDCRFDLADAASHIPGSLNAHLDHDLSGPVTPGAGRHPLPDPDGLVRWPGACGVDFRCQVVAYGDSGGSMAMEAAGLPGARLYAGSWSEWIRDRARPMALGAG
jgi:thiosulfate/3-mercaptopyruvate sulfurtransferase